ncbi:MAG: PQQ-binding-like beta-propeller repeat protein [Acidobacteria bacterium]|nr:PQQ-binding-like beta-propeller repeat protein [Acidobacteriota bacterium]
MLRTRLSPCFSVAVVLLAIASAAVAADTDWSSFRGPAGAGEAKGLPRGDGSLALELAWKRDLGSGYSGISVAGGTLVTAMTDGERDFVVALEANSGEELWRYDLDPAHVGHDGTHDGPISTPALADGRVFMLSPGGRLVALELSTGEELWTRHLVDDLGSERPFYDFGSSPAVVGETMILLTGGDEGLVTGFDVASGAVKWRALPEDGELGLGSPILAEIAGAVQALILGPSWIAGLDPQSGATLWRHELEGERGVMGSFTQSPVPIDGNRIFVKHEQGRAVVIEVVRGESDLVAREVSAGRGLSRSYSPPALSGELLFGYTSRFLSSVEPATGELLWRSRAPGDGFLVAVGGELAVLTKVGDLHLGAAAAEGWQETSRIELFDDLARTAPSYSAGALYVRSLGEIARVELVRQAGPGSLVAEVAVPAALADLADEIADSEDPGAAVSRFLAGRELPLIDGEAVVFLWHGPADDVAVAGEMIGMRREEQMNRLGGTELWWWATELGSRARIGYVFIVDDELETDPSHERTATSTVLGPDMSWNRGEGFEMSWFAMPEWPGLKIVDKAGDVGPKGRLETFEVVFQPPTPEDGEAPEPVAVPVHVWLPPGYETGEARYPVVYVHHGQAREVGAWPATLDRVVGRTAEPLIVVFPETPRMRGAGGFVTGDLVPAIDQRYRTRAQREGRANVGMGWPGFSATLLTFNNPDIFGGLGVQSLFLLEEQMKAVEEAIGAADGSSLAMKLYLEWGRWDLISPHEEMNMRASSRWAWELYRQKGWDPIGGEVWDSTDFASWSHRTAALLESLFPLEGTEGSLAGWQTGQ